MASLTPPQALALGRYWSEIYGGAAARLSTSDMFTNIRQRAADLGLPSVGVSAAAISTLRGYATGIIRAADALGNADPSAPLDSSMIAATPWGRSLAAQNAMPVFNVAFQHTIQQDDGQTVSVWHTITFTGVLPSTVADLQEAVASEAALLARESAGTSPGSPHGTSLDVSDLSLTAV